MSCWCLLQTPGPAGSKQQVLAGQQERLQQGCKTSNQSKTPEGRTRRGRGSGSAWPGPTLTAVSAASPHPSPCSCPAFVCRLRGGDGWL